MTKDSRSTILDMAEHLDALLIVALRNAKKHAEDLAELRTMTRDLKSVLRDDGQPR
jgi:hypothetical protein